jgi:hypothetical protein
MSDHQLTISLAPKNPAALKRRFAGRGAVPFVYLGGDFRARCFLEQNLGSAFIAIDIARLHEEVTNDLRNEYIRWIDHLNYRYGNDLEWWFGSISSRNISSSNLFQFSCYLEILRRLWRGSGQRPRLAVVESAGLARAMHRWAQEQGIEVRGIPAHQLGRNYCGRLLASLGRWGHFGVDRALRLMAAVVSRRHRRTQPLPSSEVIVLHTFLHDSCFSGGKFHDRYFPYLHDFLAAKGYKVLVHPVISELRVNYLPLYRRLRQSSTRFVIAEDYLRARDYLAVLSYSWRAWRRRLAAPRFRNFDLVDILKEEQARQCDASSLGAVLMYRLVLRLGEAGLRPQRIIAWYENQVGDKALIAGARRAFPGARIIGAQMFIYFSNILNLIPSRSEADAKLVPHLLLCTSEYHCRVARSWAPDLPCFPAAALRYAHLYGMSSPAHIPAGNQTVQVVLPFDLGESVELLEVLLKALRQMDEEISISIKCHPDYVPGDLVRAFGRRRWPGQLFRLFPGTLEEALDAARVVVSANTGAIVEALAKGIPVIILKRQTALDQKLFLPVAVDFLVECFTAQEVAVALHRCLRFAAPDRERFKETGRKIRTLCFEPINDQTMLPFLG